ncbi:hypothetical protein SORBI_3001G453000 [Sorghum bicolor]|uniref:NAC domain-containing protein n=1 Tax=Sorghum bicolor TaxID=4558 RepID=A0A1Z5SAN1_SORBI|nr:hypothetical protein SORBI_3001G453000 [Sorghum bicolor]
MFFAGSAPDPTVLMHCESWPGLPRGVEFNPSDSDILWHLAAEVGNGRTERHPFIHEFIKFVDGDGGFYCRHPQDIPGVRQDGRASYFFHRSFEPCNNENDASNCWKKIGSPRSIILGGTLQGCKEVFALYADMTSDKSSQETDWRLHQYHLQNTVKAESEIVVSKIFLASRNNLCELAEEGRIESEQYVSTHKDSSVECAKGFNFEICTEIDELDHIPLKERYRILLADKSSGLGTVSTGKSIMCVETSRSSPKRNHEGTTHKEDICSMLQEISSAPPIIESNPMDDNSNMTLLGEDLPVEGSENQIDGTATCMSENSELVARKQGAHLADVKLEPALEGYKIGPSESPQANSTHAKGSVPSLGVKDELTDCELPEKVSFSSRQRRKRKTSCSTEKMLEEDADTVKEGVAYRSRRRRKKTATDSIEKALDEDAPGLLQILLNRGIGVEEIKLYGAEEDNEMIEDSTESNFEDLENVIANIFPKKGKGYLLSVSRYERGEKAIYCLSCLISLIEQSRYLQFRDCPVEWGWCRDLQSFIFVFTSHNRIVLERPEYGYATYFFEVVQSTPIEWQIRRLVVAMKLSGCGRTALIENRPLMVGEDLTEGGLRNVLLIGGRR